MFTWIFGFAILAIVATAAAVLTLAGVSDPRDDPGRRLVVYGSLAPGKKNHGVIAHMRGEWRPCSVTGVMAMKGGHNVLTWQRRGPKVEALLFESVDLPGGWDALDEFEGDDYRRVVVPVEVEGRWLSANVYVEAR